MSDAEQTASLGAVVELLQDGTDAHISVTIESVDITIVDGVAAEQDPAPGGALGDVSSVNSGNTVTIGDDERTVAPDVDEDIVEAVADATDGEPDDQTPDVDPDEFDTAEVRDYANGPVLYLGAPAGRFFDTERVHVVRTEQNDVEVRPGGSDEWPDYTVGASAIQVGTGGLDLLGVSAGDEVDVHAKPDRGVLVLDPLTISGARPEYECDDCGTEFSSQTSKQNHLNNTACGAELPDDMTAADFEELVAEADTVTDVKQALRTNRIQTEALLEQHGLDGNVASADARKADIRGDGVTLPDGLTEGDVHAVAEMATSVEGAAANMEVSPRRAEKILRAHDCIDEVRGGEADD